MIRPITLLAFGAFIGSGLYLYQVKHQAQLVDRQIDKIHAATDLARERARLLVSEYERLNDPERLATLAATYLTDLKPTQPGQWSSMAEIDRRLPGVGGPTAEPAPLEPAVPNQEVPTATAEPAPAIPEAPRPAPRPAQVAAAQPAAAPVAVAMPTPSPAVAASAFVPRPMPRAAAPRVAAAQPARVPAPVPSPVNLAHGTPAPLSPAPMQLAAAPLPALRPVAAPMPSLLPRVSPPTGASVLAISTRPAAHTDPYGAPSPVPMVASALGMARTMTGASPYAQSAVR
jgi:hypothetical protein